MPRPWPLAMTGSCSCSAAWRAADSAPSIQTSEPSTRTGRSATASSPAIWLIAAGSGPGRGAAAAAGSSASALSYSASSDTSRNTGPRCGAAASRKASSADAATRAVECSVQARLVTGASSGGWSISCRLPAPQR